LVNPAACHETELVIHPVKSRRSIAVVGAGPAGLAFATTAAGRGHKVTLFEASDKVGGQFNLAKKIPGKDEFNETIRYFTRRLEITGVEVRLNTRVGEEDLEGGGFDDVVLATGVHPRRIQMPGIEHPKVLSYLDVLRGEVEVGDKVAIIGAGGIGFDVAELLAHKHPPESNDMVAYFAQWGIDPEISTPGGLKEPRPVQPQRTITLCQRSSGKVGGGLGKTTGWIHRSSLKSKGVKMLNRCTYQRIDDQGLHLVIEDQTRVLEVDHVVICAGQVPNRDLYQRLQSIRAEVHLIGGADVASELDAKRAIEQGTRLAARL